MSDIKISKLFRFTPAQVKETFKRTIKRKRYDGLEVVVAPKKETWGRLLVVTPAHIGNAPKRNRIRRRLKAIFYEHRLFEHDYDMIVLVKKEGINTSFDQLKKIMLEAIDGQ